MKYYEEIKAFPWGGASRSESMNNSCQQQRYHKK